MTAINKILKMAEDNNGMVTSAMIDAANISRGCLKYRKRQNILCPNQHK